MTATPSGWIPLRSDLLAADIDPQGAQLSLLRDARNNDLLWNGDPAVWKGRAPNLFPIVGELNGGQYRWRGQSFPLGRHGFARDRAFTVVRHDESEAIFRLVDDAQSRAVYPFSFVLNLVFTVARHQLSVVASVHNTGSVPMPASLGFHPAFRWPLPGGAAREACFLEFDAEEIAAIRRLDSKGLLTDVRHATPVRGRRLLLEDSLFSSDVVILDQLASRSVTFGADRGPRIRVSYPDATHLGLWTKPGAGFLCIEPWRGVADPQGFDGELDLKPGTFLVPPGGSESLTMRIEALAE